MSRVSTLCTFKALIMIMTSSVHNDNQLLMPFVAYTFTRSRLLLYIKFVCDTVATLLLMDI